MQTLPHFQGYPVMVGLPVDIRPAINRIQDLRHVRGVQVDQLKNSIRVTVKLAPRFFGFTKIIRCFNDSFRVRSLWLDAGAHTVTISVSRKLDC